MFIPMNLYHIQFQTLLTLILFLVRPLPGESAMEKGWVPEVIVAACVSLIIFPS